MIDVADTPFAAVDLDAVDRNIRRMQGHSDALGVRFRPHVKTHKIPGIAALQIDAGAVGITCQKLGEAEVMADGGIDDILMSFPLVGAAKRVCGIELAPSVVAVIFTVFDADGDGSLSPAEFLDVMERRRKMQGASGEPSLFECCTECISKWRDASSS